MVLEFAVFSVVMHAVMQNVQVNIIREQGCVAPLVTTTYVLANIDVAEVYARLYI